MKTETRARVIHNNQNIDWKLSVMNALSALPEEFRSSDLKVLFRDVVSTPKFFEESLTRALGTLASRGILLRHKESREGGGLSYIYRKPHKYQNPDQRCQMLASGCDYCWSFAHHIDGSDGYDNILPICEGCQMWKQVRSKTDAKMC